MNLPSETVTFLFTDIEGSTRLWEEQPEAMRVVLARHDALMRRSVESANGFVFKTIGDAFCAAFSSPEDAVRAVVAAQGAIHAEPWPDETAIRVRMALHTGFVECRENDYFGPPLNRVARLLATGHGGQSLLSDATVDLVRDSLPDGVSLRDLGRHRLKDLGTPAQVYQLQHPDLPSDFPPIRSLSTHPTNLPNQLTSFIGREKLLSEINTLMSSTRLVTLVGSGGCGKTRLAVQAAAEVLERFTDGIWLVELASLADPDLAPQSIADVLGMNEEPDKQILQTIVDHLKSRSLLIILDNCEHLLDASATLVDTILRNCPKVQFLVTSREGLGISGETALRVTSLSHPDPKSDLSPESLYEFEAVRLFADRASQTSPGFQITIQNAPAVASICHRLDGIPLAIELAAARVRSLTVDDINSKLDQRFRLLTGGSRTALPRQQTLRSLIDWSYDLLNEAEKALLARLSVFSGGWTLEAAEKVCAGEPIDEWETLDLLTSLADKSLVLVEASGASARYRFLETVRQYARDRLLLNGEAERWRDRHLAHFLAMSEEAEPKLTGAEQADWLDRLETEHDNLRTAMEWTSDSNVEPNALPRLCSALWRFWDVRGHIGEGRSWCATALDRTEPDAEWAVGKTLSVAGNLATSHGDYAAARDLLERSLEIRTRIGDRDGVARSLNNLGLVAWQQGEYSEARSFFERSLDIKTELGDRQGMARTLSNLATVAQELADYAGAHALLAQALEIQRGVGDVWSVALSLNNLGSGLIETRDFPAARKVLEESLALRREVGDRVGIATSVTNLGIVALEQNDIEGARAFLAQGLTYLQDLGDRRVIAHLMEIAAALAASVEDTSSAAKLWGAAEQLRLTIGSPLPQNEQPAHKLRVSCARAQASDNAVFDAAWEDGRAMTLEQAMALAMQVTSQPAHAHLPPDG